MRLSHTTATFLVVMAANYAMAQVVLKARFDTSCGYLANKIYCFGGATSNSPKVSDAIMNMLDISANSGSTADELKNKWVTVNTDPHNLNIKARDEPQSMQMPDGKTLLISGGWAAGNVGLDSQTIAFNGETQSWDGYANYIEEPYGNRQIYRASSVYVPEYGVGFYGGVETNYNSDWTYPGVNLTGYQNENLHRRYIGYTSLTFLDIRNLSNPWSTYPTQNNLPIGFSLHQQPIFDAKSNRIFFFGGEFKDSLTETSYTNSFANSVTFDLAKGEWGKQTLNGQGPTPRFGHSATLLGASQRHVLIYGGQTTANNDRALSDYCFTLDLDTYQWTQQIIPATADVALVRTQHSAVTVNNDTVFIVFGRDETEKPTLSLLILNVTNPLNITLLDKYVNPTAISNTSDTKTVSKTKLSSGATIAIGVGITAAGLIAIAAILFYILKKRKNVKKYKEESLMEVNWDEIEKKYIEAPTHPVGHVNYSPQSAGGTTVVDTSSVPNSLSPMLVHKGLEMRRPDAIDGEAISVVNRDPLLQKPDAA